MTVNRNGIDQGAVSKRTVTAKGNLIVGTANSVVSNLTVGNDGETIVADSSTSTGLRYQNFKTVNYCLNSDTSIWQRGTSIASAASVVYGADRWSFYRAALATGATVSRQAAGLTGFQYSMRIARDSGNTNTEQIVAFQALESSQSIPLAGKSITFSFWAKAGANLSSTGSILSATLSTGTGTDQSPNTFRFGGWTSQATSLNVSPVITTTWARYSGTVTLGSSITQIGLALGFVPTGTAGANDWVEVTGIQLEVGSVATAFQTATGTIQGELAAAQRYFEVIANDTVSGVFYSTSAAYCIAKFNVPKRSSAALTMTYPSTLTNGLYEVATAFRTPTALANEALGIDQIGFTATGMTSGTIGKSLRGTFGVQITASAEL